MVSSWMPRIDRAKCTACGECITLCPVNALGLQDGKAALIHEERCTYCTICEEICPVNAIELPFLIIRRQTEEENF